MYIELYLYLLAFIGLIALTMYTAFGAFGYKENKKKREIS